MQFDGNWTAVKGVVVDKLGKYAYAIPGVGGAPATPFILDVALDVRAKVCPPLPIPNHGWHSRSPPCVLLGRVRTPCEAGRFPGSGLHGTFSMQCWRTQ